MCTHSSAAVCVHADARLNEAPPTLLCIEDNPNVPDPAPPTAYQKELGQYIDPCSMYALDLVPNCDAGSAKSQLEMHGCERNTNLQGSQSPWAVLSTYKQKQCPNQT